MPERPLLILPTPVLPQEKQKRSGGPEKINIPTRDRQAERLTPKFTALQEYFDQQRARLAIEARGAVPEEVLVLETIGSVEDFYIAVRNISGMEWLGEIEEEDMPPDDDFFALDSKGRCKPEKTLRGRAYLIFSNHQAFDQMLSLWDRWQNNKSLPRGQGKWAQLIAQLHDIRPWGIQDRLLETGVLEDWKDRVEHNEEVVPCEIELWFRKAPDTRIKSRERVTNLITALQGRVIHESVIDQIAYHAILAELPIAAVSNVVNGTALDTSLLQCGQVQFFRATGQMSGILPDGERNADYTTTYEPEVLGDPIVALLDGLPLQQHSSLAGHLIIDDPDDIESQYQANERRHGTAMASLIIHGDLENNENPLLRKIYLRPILQPDHRYWKSPRPETIAENTLVVDLIHRAVRRIFEGEGNEPPVAPSVCVINLSIGIRDRLFYGALSPLARLIDWLAWKYKVLFIVSAGNHTQPFVFDIARDQFSNLSSDEIQKLFIRAIASDTRNRRLLSPAEAVNVLTIGALHEDNSGSLSIPRSIIPFTDQSLPSPINAQGMGYRRAIKPEILAPGGKIVLLESLEPSPNASFNIYSGTLAPGQKVAAPGSRPGDLSSTWYTRGTSNSAALTSRAADQIYDVLEELQSELGGDLINTIPTAVWLKALLTHGTEWGISGDILGSILRTSANSRKFKEYLSRIIGYGRLDDKRVRECEEYRVTALSGGNLRNDQAHLHQFPLPPSLSGPRCWRRLTITLAWLTPINPLHQGWRRAALWYAPPKDILRVERQEADWQATKRGTVQHEILEGEKASAFVDGDNLEISVNCVADAGALEDTIPYALITTLEVKEEIGIPLYEEVKVRVHAARIRVTPSA